MDRPGFMVELPPLDPIVRGREPASHSDLPLVPLSLPGGHRPLQLLPRLDPPMQAPALQPGPLDLGHVLPAAALRRVAGHRPLDDPPGRPGRECLVQAGDLVGVRIVNRPGVESPGLPHGGPPQDDPAPPASSWAEAEVQSVRDADRLFLQDAARRRDLDPSEVAALLRDHLLDPDPRDGAPTSAPGGSAPGSAR